MTDAVTVQAMDADGDTLSGPDASSSTIDENTGQIKVGDGTDRNAYEVVVIATDPSRRKLHYRGDLQGWQRGLGSIRQGPQRCNQQGRGHRHHSSLLFGNRVGGDLPRKALAMLIVVGATFGAAGLLHLAPADATSHSVSRSFSASSVLPGKRLEVTIVATGYGSFGLLVETLPAGFSYASSELSKSAVVVEGQAVSFVLIGDQRFTYVVTAPSAEGVYSFSGFLKDFDKVEQSVGGDSSIRVGPDPTRTPQPTATPTPQPTATPTPQPTATPTPQPTATPTPQPTATPTPEPPTTPTPQPTATPTPQPTATPTPQPTATPTAVAAPEPEQEGGAPWTWIIIGLVIAAVIGGGAAYFAMRNRR